MLMRQGSVSYDTKPEISLLLKLVIFRYGIYDPLSGSSPGSRLQNLRLASTAGSHLRQLSDFPFPSKLTSSYKAETTPLPLSAPANLPFLHSHPSQAVWALESMAGFTRSGLETKSLESDLIYGKLCKIL